MTLSTALPSVPRGARHPRRAVVLVLVAVLALLGVGVASAPDAHAATRPSLTAVPGATVASTSWTVVPGATSYVVQLSTTSAFPKPKSVTTAARSKVFGGLKNGTTYYVRVRASAGTSTSWSSVVPVVPTARTAVTSAKVTAGGTDKIRVSWTRLSWGTSVYVVASYNNETLDDRSDRWTVRVPLTASSATVTIPAKYRARIGSKTGNPVYVRVVTYNGSVRYQSAMVYGFPTPPAVTGTPNDLVSIAAYNVQGVTPTENLAGRTWMDRRAAVGAAIARNNPMVVAVQEATTMQINGTRHYLDLAAVLRPRGYALAYDEATVGNAGSGATKGAHLFYRSADVQVLSAGIESTRTWGKKYVPTVRWIDENGDPEVDRWFAWALMRSTRTGAEFYVASIHLEVGSHKNNKAVRTAAAKGVRGFLNERAAKDGNTDLPVIVAGDFNSDVERFPTGPTTDFIAQGYVDAAATVSPVYNRYGTTNSASRATDGGYPAKPTMAYFVGTRIDHIMVKGGSGSTTYANQIVLTGSGTFDERYRGSDHNLQFARVAIRG